jgi:hypothetical protein
MRKTGIGEERTTARSQILRRHPDLVEVIETILHSGGRVSVSQYQ